METDMAFLINTLRLTRAESVEEEIIRKWEDEEEAKLEKLDKDLKGKWVRKEASVMLVVWLSIAFIIYWFEIGENFPTWVHMIWWFGVISLSAFGDAYLVDWITASEMKRIKEQVSTGLKERQNRLATDPMFYYTTVMAHLNRRMEYANNPNNRVTRDELVILGNAQQAVANMQENFKAKGEVSLSRQTDLIKNQSAVLNTILDSVLW